MEDLDDVLKILKAGKCRDSEGLIREFFKDEVFISDLTNLCLSCLTSLKIL